MVVRRATRRSSGGSAVIPTIVALGTSGGAAAIGRELAEIGVAEWHETADALIARVARGHVEAIVCGLRDETQRSIAPTLVAVCAAQPLLPMVLHARVDGVTLHEWLAVAATGLRLEGAVRPHEPLAPVLRRVLASSYRAGVGALLLQSFVPLAPPSVRAFVAIGALGAAARRSVERVALWSGVTPRTIERRLRRARWPAARTVLRSFAALDAVWLMTEYGWSARRVQKSRGFAHESSVTRLLARYAGLRPATLREAGGFAAALAHVTRVLAESDE